MYRCAGKFKHVEVHACPRGQASHQDAADIVNTMVLHGIWPTTPTLPDIAIDFGLMDVFVKARQARTTVFRIVRRHRRRP